MSHRVTINAQSVRKYADGTYGAQVIVSHGEGLQSFYACKINSDMTIQSHKIYEFIAGSWRIASIGSSDLSLICSLMTSLISRYHHLFSRKLRSTDGAECYAMPTDAVVQTSSNGHKIKISDRVFHTKTAFTLTGAPTNGQYIDFEIIGEPYYLLSLNLNDHPDIKARLEKQLVLACNSHRRAKANQPIGGMSWASLQNDRKSFGKSNRDHRQLQRDRK